MTASESNPARDFVVLRTDHTGPREFVTFWGQRYADPREPLYEGNIGKPLTPESVMALFEWKNGGKLSAPKAASVHKHYISLIGAPLPSEIRGFLKSFGPSKGGAIWPIFWLHCCDRQFPIFDQHVYRAMKFIQRAELDELEGYPDDRKVDLYLDIYVPFHNEIAVPGRETDKALWTFGKFLKANPDLLRSSERTADEG